MLVLACGDGGDATDAPHTGLADASAGVETIAEIAEVEVEAEPSVFAPPDMGDACAISCRVGDVCYLMLAGCQSLCLHDKRPTTRMNYCSMPCDEDGQCPPSYACIEAGDTMFGDEPLMVCGALEAVCGNGRREVREVCDDGNTDSGDLCAANCMRETNLRPAGV